VLVDGVVVCGTGVAVDGLGVAVCGVGLAVDGVGDAAWGVGAAVCGVGLAVWPDGVAVCAANDRLIRAASPSPDRHLIMMFINTSEDDQMRFQTSLRRRDQDCYPVVALDRF